MLTSEEGEVAVEQSQEEESKSEINANSALHDMVTKVPEVDAQLDEEGKEETAAEGSGDKEDASDDRTNATEAEGFKLTDLVL